MTIEELLAAIAGLLESHNEAEWAKSFHRIASDFKHDPDGAKGSIRSIYGGMGSFNDVILHDANGIPLNEENDRLQQMRSDLFQKCR